MNNCLDDEKLIENYLKGSRESLEILINRHLKPIYFFIYKRIGNSSEAEDITQDVFVKAWKNIKKFDRKKSFKVWIFAIAKNASIDFYKKKRAILFSEINREKDFNFFEDAIADQKLLPGESFDSDNISKLSLNAIGKLPEKYRDVITLRYYNDLTFREIAGRLKEPLNTVKSRCRRAVFALKKFLPKNLN